MYQKTKHLSCSEKIAQESTQLYKNSPGQALVSEQCKSPLYHAEDFKTLKYIYSFYTPKNDVKKFFFCFM